jgi:hypothetical protein
MFGSNLMSKTLVLVAVVSLLCVSSSAHAVVVDSFFDVFVDVMIDGDVAYESVLPTKYQDIEVEMVSMKLTSNADPRVVVHEPDTTGVFHVDSFFDITYEINPNDGGNWAVDSFFDVFTELSIDPLPLDPEHPDTQVFAVEILSMNLDGAQGPTSIYELGLMDGVAPIGEVSITQLPDGTFHVDSFFDVFTEITIEDGTPPVAAIDVTRLEWIGPDVPEPSTITLLILGSLSLLAWGYRKRAL